MSCLVYKGFMMASDDHFEILPGTLHNISNYNFLVNLIFKVCLNFGDASEFIVAGG